MLMAGIEYLVELGFSEFARARGPIRFTLVILCSMIESVF